MQTNSCPCCRSALLRHIRRSNLYWFCSSCRQEMPDCLTAQPVLITRLTPPSAQPKTAA